LGFISATG
jgi:hypothetical protein